MIKEEHVRSIRYLGLAAAVTLGVGGTASAFDNCTPTGPNAVHIVYFGATAVNPTIHQAAVNLYGAPLSTCSSTIKTYRALKDLDGLPGNETCVTLYVGSSLGSCEGVDALDKQLGNFNVCTPTAGSTTQVLVSTQTDENGQSLFDNFAGSDVAADLCVPVIGDLTNPDIFDETENRAFVTPFSLISNRSIEAALPASKKIPYSGANCPGAYAGDCQKIDLSLTKDQIKGIFANNNICDWRTLDQNIDPNVARAVGAVMRNRLSGTRRNFNATMLENLGAGQGEIFVAGSGDVVNRVNNNQWCLTNPSECGESASGVIGGRTSPCQSVPNNSSIGYIGTDRLRIIDPDSPANPFDDYGIRGNATDNYTPLGYQGEIFNKVKVRCGHYEYWSIERLYYNNLYAPLGSRREAAVLQLINQTSADAVTDPTVVALSQMFVTRARDGAPIFPTGAYNAFCHEP